MENNSNGTKSSKQTIASTNILSTKRSSPSKVTSPDHPSALSAKKNIKCKRPRRSPKSKVNERSTCTESEVFVMDGITELRNSKESSPEAEIFINAKSSQDSPPLAGNATSKIVSSSSISNSIENNASDSAPTVLRVLGAIRTIEKRSFCASSTLVNENFVSSDVPPPLQEDPTCSLRTVRKENLHNVDTSALSKNIQNSSTSPEPRLTIAQKHLSVSLIKNSRTNSTSKTSSFSQVKRRSVSRLSNGIQSHNNSLRNFRPCRTDPASKPPERNKTTDKNKKTDVPDISSYETIPISHTTGEDFCASPDISSSPDIIEVPVPRVVPPLVILDSSSPNKQSTTSSKQCSPPKKHSTSIKQEASPKKQSTSLTKVPSNKRKQSTSRCPQLSTSLNLQPISPTATSTSTTSALRRLKFISGERSLGRVRKVTNSLQPIVRLESIRDVTPRGHNAKHAQAKQNFVARSTMRTNSAIKQLNSRSFSHTPSDGEKSVSGQVSPNHRSINEDIIQRPRINDKNSASRNNVSSSKVEKSVPVQLFSSTGIPDPLSVCQVVSSSNNNSCASLDRNQSPNKKLKLTIERENRRSEAANKNSCHLNNLRKFRNNHLLSNNNTSSARPTPTNFVIPLQGNADSQLRTNTSSSRAFQRQISNSGPGKHTKQKSNLCSQPALTEIIAVNDSIVSRKFRRTFSKSTSVKIAPRNLASNKSDSRARREHIARKRFSKLPSVVQELRNYRKKLL